jgi:HD-GYP domain-containing protein (c-di-GMP phosphodiesterase class II)
LALNPIEGFETTSNENRSVRKRGIGLSNLESEILQVATCLNGAVSNTRLYAADHPQVLRYLERAYDQLQRVLKSQSTLTFLVVEDEVIIDNRAVTTRTPQLEQFVQLLKQGAIERLTFSSDVTIQELTQLVGDLASPHKEVVRSTPAIKLGKVVVQPVSGTDPPDTALSLESRQRLEALADLRQHSLDELKDAYRQIQGSHEIFPSGISEMVQGFLQGMLRNVNPLRMLASLKSTDEYTFTHAINVCILTMAQAEALGIDGRLLRDIGVAASLHDAGKMFISDDILNKPDKLTEDEWKHMRSHSAQGAQYILRLPGVPKMAFLAALEHHIRYDGTGYPDLGKGWQPNIVSQMIAIADVFDAMRSRRPYKEPKPDALIVKILQQESGSTFNPHLVRNFLQLIHPKGGADSEK